MLFNAFMSFWTKQKFLMGTPWCSTERVLCLGPRQSRPHREQRGTTVCHFSTIAYLKRHKVTL